ncbi:sensor histidine kinase [Hymenobacter glaciei]
MPLPLARVKTVLIHAAAWLGYYTYEVCFLIMMKESVPSPGTSLLTWSLNAALVYSNALWLFPRYLLKRRYAAYALGLLGVMLTFGAMRYGMHFYLLPSLGLKVEPLYTPAFQPFIAGTYYRGTIFLGYSLLYAYASHSIGLLRRLREQEHQLRLQERSLLEADIAFLKSQINPHFLFNALNFLYAQVYPLSEPTAKSVLLLSDIMRYALHEGSEHGKVALDKEVQHLRNYLALSKLRFGDQLQVQFDTEGSTRFLLVLPLVLINFVENCFKHGELFDAAHPVLLRLDLHENQLTFFTHNRKRTGPVEHSTGIGLENTRRRLDAVYPGRYELRVIDEPTAYSTYLHLTL